MARFRMIAVYEGIPTGDRRQIAVGSLHPRELPLTLMGMTVNPEMGGHGLAEVAGRIDTLTRVDASAWVDGSTGQSWSDVAGGAPVSAWVGEGEFGEDEYGQKIEGMVRDRSLRGVSVDLAAVTSELDVLEEDEDGWPVDWLDTVTDGEIAAATVCNVPAFRGCTIEVLVEAGQIPDPAAPPEPEAVAASASWLPPFTVLPDGGDCVPCRSGEPGAIVAGAGPLAPPAAWFADPQLDGPTPLTITDDGRIFGHLATWGTCHIGSPGQCVTPPRSATGYALFHSGAVRTAEGTDVPTGRVTLGTGHADLRSGLRAAVEHYDDTGTAAADVAAGDDQWGIWIAGGLRSTLTDEQIRELRAAPLSGDWRGHGRNLELVAALAVNVPGFPIPRTRSLAASGATVALVAAGVQAQPTLHRATADDPTLSDDLRALAGELRTERLELAAERHLRRLGI